MFTDTLVDRTPLYACKNRAKGKEVRERSISFASACGPTGLAGAGDNFDVIITMIIDNYFILPKHFTLNASSNT